MIKITGKKFLCISVQSILFRLLSLFAFLPISAWSQLYLGEGTQITISEGTYIHSSDTDKTKISSIDSEARENVQIYVVKGTKITGQFTASASSKIVYQEKSSGETKKEVHATSKKEKVKLAKATKKEKKLRTPDITWTYRDKGEDKAYHIGTRSFSAVVINNVNEFASFSDYQYKIVKNFIEPKVKISSYCFLRIYNKQYFDYNRRGPPVLYYMNNHNS
ncbi:hypothetical protein [Chryseobacterium sp.]|uniref:hypothetical protein n=1 Tax=Chryseobacterium sp. TaxID=1871047 RepID=UPI0025B8A54F|nr:hypothetical protein [Chryseobacterium sp.]